MKWNLVKPGTAVFFMLLAFASCKQNRELHREFYPDKTLKLECQVVKQGDVLVTDGYYKKYFSNGNLKVSENYLLGKLDGKSDQFWDNKQLRTSIIYKNDLIWQQDYYRDKNGRLLDSMMVKNGEGALKHYYKDGTILSTQQISKGAGNGMRMEYTEDGKIKSEENFVSGLKQGKATHISNDFKSVLNYENGLANGEAYVYDTLNNLIYRSKLKQGIVIDTSFTYYKNGSIKEFILYKSSNFDREDSSRLGLITEAGILGQLQPFSASRGIMLKGFRYDENGKLLKELKYENNMEQF